MSSTYTNIHGLILEVVDRAEARGWSYELEAGWAGKARTFTLQVWEPYPEDDTDATERPQVSPEGHKSPESDGEGE